MIIIFRLLLQG